MQRRKVVGILAVLTVVAAGVTAWSGLAQAKEKNRVVRVEESNVRVDDAIQISEESGSRVIVAHITVDPGDHTPWHYHPGPHIVSVKTGTVAIYETDCSSKTYPAGTGFYDPGRTDEPHIHTLRNPSSNERAEVVITDIRHGDLRPTIVADPQPAPCFS